ncbi:MAG: type II toxin-antitoxin system Phd/YefM family antitoxin [Armatimonadetes bacterium]|nr:type II toxin-antitoxin system Phd/YefM family antitoxin [Armatimonadota bacterium]
MYHIRTTQLRCEIGAVVSRAEYAKERIVIERRGKPVAAVVPIEDLAALGKLEDQLDIAEAERILADPNSVWLTLEEAEAELDL